ncbi:rod shape-determining protein, partial [Candidatus Curtissbacteria bacterium]|nr:rod shape-determining protein [Candidatus Curtissbacteria bacterium]
MFSKRIGIDLGTANSLVYLEGKGVVLNEPSVVAVDEQDGRVVAVGNEAREMLGRTPEGIVASRPMRDGVIADYVVTEAMLKYFIDKVCGPSRIFKPEVMVCVPSGVTSVERRAVLDATLSAGASAAYLIDEPLAAAIGARIPIALPSGNMIIDIGGGSTEAAVISLGGVVVHNSVRVAGNKIDEAIAQHIRRKYNLIIGERTSEEVKLNIGSATYLEEEKKMEVRGRDSIAGLPKIIEISSTEITESIRNPLNQIVNAIRGVLEQTPPELASDII